MLSLLCSLIIGCFCGYLISFCTTNLFQNYFFSSKMWLTRMIMGGLPIGLACFLVLKKYCTCKMCGKAFQIHHIKSRELSTQYISQNIFLDPNKFLHNSYLRKLCKNKSYIVKEYQDDYKCNNCQNIKTEIYFKSWDVDAPLNRCISCGTPFTIHKVFRTERGRQFIFPGSIASRERMGIFNSERFNRYDCDQDTIIQDYTSYFSCNQCGKEHKQAWSIIT